MVNAPAALMWSCTVRVVPSASTSGENQGKLLDDVVPSAVAGVQRELDEHRARDEHGAQRAVIVEPWLTLRGQPTREHGARAAGNGHGRVHQWVLADGLHRLLLQTASSGGAGRRRSGADTSGTGEQRCPVDRHPIVLCLGQRRQETVRPPLVAMQGPEGRHRSGIAHGLEHVQRLGGQHQGAARSRSACRHRRRRLADGGLEPDGLSQVPIPVARAHRLGSLVAVVTVDTGESPGSARRRRGHRAARREGLDRGRMGRVADRHASDADAIGFERSRSASSAAGSPDTTATPGR